MKKTAKEIKNIYENASTSIIREMTAHEIRFEARIDNIAISADEDGEPDVGAIHIAYSDIGIVGRIENYGTMIFPNIEKLFYRVDNTLHFEPCDTVITIRRNYGKNYNPMINASFYIVCEVINHEV